MRKQDSRNRRTCDLYTLIFVGLNACLRDVLPVAENLTTQLKNLTSEPHCLSIEGRLRNARKYLQLLFHKRFINV